LLGINWAQLSIGTAALLIIGFLGARLIDGVFSKQRDEMKTVIENNTTATNNLLSFLQVTLTKNQAEMGQVVENTKHIPGMDNRVNDIWQAVKPEK
jgi:hypothetical protein